MSIAIGSNRLLFDNADWDFATIQRINDAVEEIAIKELGYLGTLGVHDAVQAEVQVGLVKLE